MANGHGGKRRPRNPAQISGPGKMSRRTDGGPQQVQAKMTGMAYGENKDFQDIQSSAPMSASSNVPKPSAARVQQASVPQATPLFSQTNKPDEPITAGASVGPGPGPAAQPSYSNIVESDAKMLKQFLPDLMKSAARPDAPAGFVRFVRHLRDIQGA